MVGVWWWVGWGRLGATFILLLHSLFVMMKNGWKDRETQNGNKKPNPNTPPLDSSICYTTPPLQDITTPGHSPLRVPCEGRRGKDTRENETSNTRTKITSKKRWLNNKYPVAHPPLLFMSYSLPVLLPKTRQERESSTSRNPSTYTSNTHHPFPLPGQSCIHPQSHHITNNHNPQHPSSKQPNQEIPLPSPSHCNHPPSYDPPCPPQSGVISPPSR